jgi:hypothetical protein
VPNKRMSIWKKTRLPFGRTTKYAEFPVLRICLQRRTICRRD